MDIDREVCHCFHVTKRKLLAFIRIENPVIAEQLSECQGAGTGCGGCRGDLRELLLWKTAIGPEGRKPEG